MTTTESRSSLTQAASWLLIARAFSFLFAVALPLFLVRHLNQVEFGLYKQAFLIVNSVTVMAPLGFAMSALYFLPREPEKQPQIVLNILLFSAGVGALVCGVLFGAPSLIGVIFAGPELVPYASALGILIMLWTVGSGFDIVAVARNDMRAASAVIIFTQLSRTGLLLSAAFFFGTLRALIVAAILQGTLQTAGFILYVRYRFPGFLHSFDTGLLRRQISYALPLGAAGILYTLQIDLHNYIVSNRFGPAMFAVYANGTAQLPLVNMLQESATSVLIPRVSLLERNNEGLEILWTTARAMRKLAAAYLPIYAALLVLGHEFIRIIFTDRYLSSWPIFAVNLTLLPLSIILMDPLYRAFAEQRYYLIRLRTALLGVVLVLLWIGTGLYGMVGAIAAVVVVNLAERVITGVRFFKLCGATSRELVLFRDIGKLAAAAGAAALVTAVVRSRLLQLKPIFIFGIGGSIFVAVYVLAVLLLRIPSTEEIQMVRDQFARILQRMPRPKGAAVAPGEAE